MKQFLRHFLPPLLIGPLVIIPLNAILFLVQAVFMPGEHAGAATFFGVIVLSVGQLFPAYLFALFYWLPAYLILQKFRKTGLTAMLISGLLPGLLLLMLPQKSLAFVLITPLYFLGITVACWFLARHFGKKP